MEGNLYRVNDGPDWTTYGWVKSPEDRKRESGSWISKLSRSDSLLFYIKYFRTYPSSGDVSPPLYQVTMTGTGHYDQVLVYVKVLERLWVLLLPE